MVFKKLILFLTVCGIHEKKGIDLGRVLVTPAPLYTVPLK